jgi:hypothetical protein
VQQLQTVAGMQTQTNDVLLSTAMADANGYKQRSVCATPAAAAAPLSASLLAAAAAACS